jgi:putative transposase
MSPWRAGCGESRTSGSEGGPRKRTGRKAGTAPRPDPYTEHPTREGKVYCAVVLDAWSRRVVGWSIDASATAALVTNALGMAIEERRPDGTVIHSDQGTHGVIGERGPRSRTDRDDQRSRSPDPSPPTRARS